MRSATSRVLGLATVLLFLSPWVLVHGCNEDHRVPGVTWLAVASHAVEPENAQGEAKSFDDARSAGERAEVGIVALSARAFFVSLACVALAGLALLLAPRARLPDLPLFAAIAGTGGMVAFALGGFLPRAWERAGPCVLPVAGVLIWRIAVGSRRAVRASLGLGLAALVLAALPEKNLLWGARAELVVLAVALGLEVLGRTAHPERARASFDSAQDERVSRRITSPGAAGGLPR